MRSQRTRACGATPVAWSNNPTPPSLKRSSASASRSTALSAGLLESVYNQCLCWEPHNDGLAYEREVPFAVVYQGVRLDKGFLADIVVENSVLLEIKYVERILPVHEAQTRTYLKLSGCRLALLMNFGTPMLKDGIRRFIN